MAPRVALLSLFCCLLSLPALASQPEGLAGQLITHAAQPDAPPYCVNGFQWMEFFGEFPLGVADTVTLDLAIIPFPGGYTILYVSGTGGDLFLEVVFSDGFVNGIPYKRKTWNDVTIQLRPATQDYLMTLNGVQAGPFPYEDHCVGQCLSVSGFRLVSDAVSSTAWVDSFSILKESPLGGEFLYNFDADFCYPQQDVAGGGFVFAHPPRSTRP